MLKYGVILMMLVALTASISCQTAVSKPADTPTDTSTILAPSPMETTDGSLAGDGWKQGQTPQSYNTGPNQVPASEEEIQRAMDSLKELKSDNITASENITESGN